MPFWLHIDSDGHRWLMTSVHGDEDHAIAEFPEYLTDAQIDWIVRACMSQYVLHRSLWPWPKGERT